MANRYIERCSRSLINREMQIKITMSCHLIPVMTAIIKKAYKTSISEGVGKNWNLCTL